MKISLKKLLVRITIVIFSVIIGLVSLEIGARIIWRKKYNEWLEKQLNGYDHLDYKRSLIIPNANTIVTVKQLKAYLLKHGKSLGLKSFEESSQNEALSDSDILFKINQYGFKGPEITIPKPTNVFRILAIGDSCTWGPYNDYYSYPRVLERELNNKIESKIKIEVVNAGVQGYNFERVIKRANEFITVEPNLITIYLGWNRTIGRADAKKNQYFYRNLGLYRIFYHFVINRNDTGLKENYQENTFYNKDDPSLTSYVDYSFKYDIQDLDSLVRIIKKKDKNIKVVLITLAGLFDIRAKPNGRSLKIAFPVASSNNLFLYPLLIRKYNEELKKYAQINNIDLIDFEEYALLNFIPRELYFQDSVHLSVKGYLEMGKFLSNKLKKYITNYNK